MQRTAGPPAAGGGGGPGAGCAVTGSKGMAFGAYAHSYAAVQLCSCPARAACVARSHVQPNDAKSANAFVPTPAPAPAPPPPAANVLLLVKSFCFQTGAKETNHLHTALLDPTPLPSPCRSLTTPAQQINGHKAFLPVAGGSRV